MYHDDFICRGLILIQGECAKGEGSQGQTLEGKEVLTSTVVRVQRGQRIWFSLLLLTSL